MYRLLLILPLLATGCTLVEFGKPKSSAFEYTIEEGSPAQPVSATKGCDCGERCYMAEAKIAALDVRLTALEKQKAASKPPVADNAGPPKPPAAPVDTPPGEGNPSGGGYQRTGLFGGRLRGGRSCGPGGCR